MRLYSRLGPCCALALLAFLMHCVTAVERRYYIAAVNINWNYDATGNQRHGPTYRKAVYREYEPGFLRAKTYPSWSGLLGPTIRGQEGDTIIVTFRNMADLPCSIHPHGIAYGKQSEGSLYFDNTSDFEKEDDVILPGREHTYSWEVTSDVAPKVADPPCVTYTYFSHQDIVKDYNTGLIGTLLICKKGSLDDSGNQIHYNQESVLLFGVFDENNSWYSKGGPPLKENVKYTINGFTNGSIPDLSVCAHSKVSWNILGMSSEPELFSVHFNGQVLQQHGHKVSSVGIISGTATSAEMVAVHAGRWLLSSHISKHLEAGMHGFLTINMCEEYPAPKRKLTIQQSRESQEWTYYIAAEEIIWDYAPNMPDNVDGEFRATYLKQSAERIGKKYKKAVFTQYKDESFKERAENKQRKKEVGILGPVIRAQIRDVIKIVFKNKASQPYSIYPHGLTIDKTAEGANYPDGGNQSHAVQPGETYTYVWRVIEEDEPLQNDSRCLTRMYHSAVNTPRDIASGLVGPLLICKSQSLNTRNVQLRSDKEQHAMFAVFDENKSWYLEENINTYCGEPKKINQDDPEFYKSNVMHTINGYVYESGQVLGFCNGEIVTWHVSSVGDQDDIQTATFYGHTFELNNREEDMLSLFPMTGETISMNMANDGIWLLASLNTHETTKGVRLKFKDVECFRDYATEDSEEYIDTKAAFSVWIPVNETKTHKGDVKIPAEKAVIDEESEYYANLLDLRTFRESGNDMEKVDLSFLDHDDGMQVEDSSPSLNGENTTNSELEHPKQNHSDLILSESFDDKTQKRDGVQNETLLTFNVTDKIKPKNNSADNTTDMEMLDDDKDVQIEDSSPSFDGEIQNNTNPEFEKSKQNQSDLLSKGFENENHTRAVVQNETLLSFSVTEKPEFALLDRDEDVLPEDSSLSLEYDIQNHEFEQSKQNHSDLIPKGFDDESHTRAGVQNETLLSFSVTEDITLKINSGNNPTDMEKLEFSLLVRDEDVVLEDSSLSLEYDIQNTTSPEFKQSKQNHSDLLLSEDFDDKNHTRAGVQNETLLSFSVTEKLEFALLDRDEDVLPEDSSLSLEYDIQNHEFEQSKQNHSDLIPKGFDDESYTRAGVQNETLLSFSVTEDITLKINSGNNPTDMEKLEFSLLDRDEDVVLEDSILSLEYDIQNTTSPEFKQSKQNHSDLLLSEDFDDENHTRAGVQNETLLSFSVTEAIMLNINSENSTADMKKLGLPFMEKDKGVRLEGSSPSPNGEVQNNTNPEFKQFKQNQSDLVLSEGFDEKNHTRTDVQNETLLSFSAADTVMLNSSIVKESSSGFSNSSDTPLLEDTDRNRTSQNSYNASLTARDAVPILSTQTSKGHGENATEAQTMDITVDIFIYSVPALKSPNNITEVQAVEDFVLLDGGDQTDIMSKARDVEYIISPPVLPNNTTLELQGNITQNRTDEEVQKLNNTRISSSLLNETVKGLNSTHADSESSRDKLQKLNSTQLLKTEGNLFSTGISVPNSSSEESTEEESREEVVIYLKNSNNTEVILTSPLNPQKENWSYEGKHELVSMDSDHIRKYITDEPLAQPNKSSNAKKEKKIVLKRVTPVKGFGMKTKKRVEYKPQPRSALTIHGFSPRGFGPRGTRPVSSEENLLGKSIVIGVPRNNFNDYELYVPKHEQDYDFDSIPDHTEDYEYVEYKDPYRKQGDVQSAVLDEASKYSLQMAGSKARAYFITAEEVNWDYAGYGQRREDKASQKERPTQFKKVVFREYLDVSFTTPYIRGEVDEHLGILGPVIKAEVDETIYIVFRNLASRPYSLHANGVSYGKNMEGLKYEDQSPYWYRQDDAVQPNTTFIYMWTVNAKIGPLQSESDCRIWTYYSGVNPERDIHSGLIGPLMVCRKGTLNKNLIDTREFMLLFMTFDESKSWYYDKNREILEKTNRKAVMDPEFSNNIKFHAINGIIYSLKGLRMYTKQLVKWHLINMGSPKDFHSIHFHGQTFLNKHTRDQRQGVYPLLPGGFATLEMCPSKPGLWLLESEIGIPQQRGMQTLFLVLDNACEQPLGLTSGTVKDSQMTASDSRGYWVPSLARLHNSGKYNAWSTTNSGEWIQVDFQRPVVISKVATQGAKQVFTSHFVLNYTISYSTDRKRWIFYKGDSKASRKIFEGNREAHEVKENIFFPPIIGRFVRLYPSHSYNYPTVRMEFYGCELDGCSVPLGMQSGNITDDQITASSFATSWYSGSWHSWLARLDKQGTINAWQAKSGDLQPWLQIDLKMVKKITGIVTQGAKALRKEMFVTAYELEYSDDGKKWTKYTDDEDYEQKIFVGNSDNNGHMKNYIYPPIFSRFVRIIPKTWQNSVTMRIELLGCDFE